MSGSSIGGTGADDAGPTGAAVPALDVTTDNETITLTEADVFTFGRSPSCTVSFDATDRSISRVAGRIEFDGSSWVLTNASTSRPLYTVDDIGLRRTLAVGSSEIIKAGVTRIVVVGSQTHELVVCLGADGSVTPSIDAEARAGNGADRTFLPSLTANERIAITAVAEGYLLPHPRHDPRPRTYNEAGDRIGVAGIVIRKRVENVRKKLLDAGVFQVEGPDARAAVVEFALAVRLVTADDLSSLCSADTPGGLLNGDQRGQ